MHVCVCIYCENIINLMYLHPGYLSPFVKAVSTSIDSKDLSRNDSRRFADDQKVKPDPLHAADIKEERKRDYDKPFITYIVLLTLERTDCGGRRAR